MLQTIEVEIDAQGVIHPMQALPRSAERRALLTAVIPEQAMASQAERADWHSFVGRLSGSPNFNSDPVQTQRTTALGHVFRFAFGVVKKGRCKTRDVTPAFRDPGLYMPVPMR